LKKFSSKSNGNCGIGVAFATPPCAFIDATTQSEIAAAQTAEIQNRFFMKTSPKHWLRRNLRRGFRIWQARRSAFRHYGSTVPHFEACIVFGDGRKAAI